MVSFDNTYTQEGKKFVSHNWCQLTPKSLKGITKIKKRVVSPMECWRQTGDDKLYGLSNTTCSETTTEIEIEFSQSPNRLAYITFEE